MTPFDLSLTFRHISKSLLQLLCLPFYLIDSLSLADYNFSHNSDIFTLVRRCSLGHSQEKTDGLMRLYKMYSVYSVVHSTVQLYSMYSMNNVSNYTLTSYYLHSS